MVKIIVALTGLLLLTGCQSTASDVSGSGFSMLHPSPASRKFIVANDLDFAREVAAHNETCASQPGCKK